MKRKVESVSSEQNIKCESVAKTSQKVDHKKTSKTCKNAEENGDSTVPSQKSKKAKKSSRFTLLIVIVLGIVCGVIVGTYLSPATVDASRYNYDVSTLLDDVDSIKTEASGKSPIEMGATKSCVLAFDKTFNESRVKVVGKGSVVAMGVTQSIDALAIRNGDTIYTENVSVSKFAQALNRYYVYGDDISHYSGKINGNTVAWNTTPDNTKSDSVKTMEQYKTKFGSTINEYMTYIVSSKTVTSASEVTKGDDGLYTFTLSLDKSKSVVNYVKTMKETGGLSSYPDFTEDPKITVTIDENYRIIKFVSSEKYKVSVGIMVDSSGSLTNMFYYDQDFAIPKITDNSVV